MEKVSPTNDYTDYPKIYNFDSIEEYDKFISNKLNRELKRNFGWAFIIMSVLTLVASYSFVFLSTINKWEVSDVVTTTIIIEAPLQMIGILVIIANNLFPKRGKIKKSIEED